MKISSPEDNPRFLAFIAILAVSGCASPALSQGVIVRSPLVGGNSGMVGPFDVGDTGYPSMRHQQVFASSDYQQRMPEGGYIDAIRFDIADRQYGGRAFAATLASIQINMSTTSRSVDGLSSVFAENIGADNSIVFDLGAITLSDFEPSGADIIIPLKTPFFYDPNAGNLLIDYFNFGRERTSFFNANVDPTDTTSTVYSTGSVHDLAGNQITGGLVTIFEVRPVPEPSTWALLALGAVVTGGRWLRLRKVGNS